MTTRPLSAPMPAGPAALVLTAPDLKALPAVAQRALNLVRDDDASVDTIAHLVEKDQALTAAVLRQANSAEAMANRRIGSLREAVARIGRRALWEVLVRACAGPLLDRGLPPYALSRHTAWRHAATASMAARRLAAHLGVGDPEEASVAGLLHDVGKVVLTSAAPERAAEAVARARLRRIPVWEAELAVLGFDHAAVGAALVRHWDLPEPVAAAIELHHAPQVSREPLAAVVSLADAAAHAVGAVGGGGACPQVDWDAAVRDALGCHPPELDVLLASLRCVEEGDL